MPSKKRSTAVQRNRRTTRMKESLSTTVDIDESKVQESSTSTPKQESNLKGPAIKLTKKEISELVEELSKELQNEIDDYMTSVTMFKLSLSSHILKAPLSRFREYREKYAIDVVENREEVEIAEPNRKVRRLRSSSADRFKVPVQIKKVKGRVSRSVTRSRNSNMKTPNISQFPSMFEMTPITPKFNLNNPVSVLRHPRLGEQAVSLSGSPLHVSIPADINPSVNVPLSDGKVMTILPLNNLNQSEMPSLDPEFRNTIKHINKYLEKMLSGNISD